MQACVPVLVHAKVKGGLQVLSSVTAGLIPMSLMMAILVRLARRLSLPLSPTDMGPYGMPPHLAFT